MTATEVVARRVREALADKNMTQTDLGWHLGMTQDALSRRLLGRTPFDVNEVEAIAAALNVPVSDLWGELFAP